MLIAVGSRASAGAVAPIYGGGGAVDAVAAGAHLLGDIPVTQARILLALLVDQGTVEQARAALDEWTTPFRDLTENRTPGEPSPATEGRLWRKEEHYG